MILTCPECSTRYQVDPGILGTGGRAVRCTKCSNTWTQTPPDDVPAQDAAADDMPTAVFPADDVPGGDVPPDDAPAEDAPGEDVPTHDDAPSEDTAPDAAGLDETDPDDLVPAQDSPPPVLPPDPLAAARGRRRAAAQAPPRRNRAAMAMWVLLAVLVIGGPSAAYFLRAEAIRVWPAAIALYDLIGLAPKPAGAGLALRDVEWKRTSDGGAELLRVTGKVANVSDRVREVPPILGVLFDKDQNELQRWTFEAPESRLLPGEKVPFTTRLKNPAPGASRLTIVFETRK